MIEDFIIMGELGLDGTVREIPGALPIVELAAKSGLRGCILPAASAREAVEYSDLEIYGVEKLDDVLEILSGEHDYGHLKWKPSSLDSVNAEGALSAGVDMSEIIGQEAAKRGVEIAAAGGHNVIALQYLFTGSFVHLHNKTNKIHILRPDLSNIHSQQIDSAIIRKDIKIKYLLIILFEFISKPHI